MSATTTAAPGYRLDPLDRNDLELYEAPIAVDFCARIRGQVKFNGVDELIDQMTQDVAATRVALVDHPCGSGQ